MIIYSHHMTHRVAYMAGFFGRSMTGEPFAVTDHIIQYLEYQGHKINYSDERIAQHEFWIKPAGLLHETGIRAQPVVCFGSNGYKAFFKTEGDLSFDIFAAVFFLLSRYEEYLPHTKDRYHRYAHENSLAYREGFLHQPLVNIWVNEWAKHLQAMFPFFRFRPPSFSFIPTYDIDEAYSFRHKEWWRSAGAAVKDILKGRLKRFKQRRRVLDGKEPDPFDSFSWIQDLHRPHKLQPRYFFLVARRISKYDRNILPQKIALQALIRQHTEKYKTGVHPSWRSSDAPELILQEKETIEKITGVKVIASRQHFIRFTLPQTYRHLLAAGIREDYSMGYGSINGFRASVAMPFYWYDLEQEQTTALQIFPFCYMEANSFFEQRNTAAQALDEMLQYYTEVKKVNGTLISIWHNTFLGTDPMFRGWRESYATFLQHVAKDFSMPRQL